MTQANQADLFGEGVYGSQNPNDPNNRPNPNNPGGVSNNELARLRARQQQQAQTQRQGNPTAGYGGSAAQQQAARTANRANVRYGKAPGGVVSDTLKIGASAFNNPVLNPIGYVAKKGGTAIDRATGVNVSGYIQDPVGQGLNDLGAPDAVQLIANPTGYVTRQAVNAGTGYGTNVPQIARNAINATGNLSNDARNARNAASAIPGAVADAARGIGGALGFTPNTYQYTPPPLVGGGGAGGGGGGGGTAISAEAQRVIDQAQQFGQQNAAMGQQYAAQAQQYAGRAAPQISAPSSAQADAVYNAAMGFRGNDSGAAGIRAAQADVSGAGRLEAFQTDMQGVSNLEHFNSVNSQRGVNALNDYNPDATDQSAAQLANFYANNTALGAEAIADFRPQQVQNDAQALRTFQGDRTGIDRLNAFADEVQGPSQAQAFLRSQSDADKRSMLALARSGRGGPAAQAQALRQAMSEGSAIAGETRGQGALLAAQEFDTYKNRQLNALAQAGSLISQSEAQRLQALSNAGALMSAADQQKLVAVQAYAQQLATQDAQQLSARQSAGQLNLGADQARLGATQSAASLQGQMDAQRLAAISNAAQGRTAADQIRSSNLQSAGQIRLQGSEINQRGQIAATQAELQASAQNLQALSLAGNISTTIRAQDISVLQSNLSASLQTMNLNDNQVRFFSQMQQDRDFQSQNIAQQAGALGVNAQVAQQANDLAWNQFAYQQLNNQQQMQYNYDALNAQQTNAAQNRVLGAAGGLLSGAMNLFGGSGGGGGGSGGGGVAPGASLPPVPNFQLSMPSTGYTPYQPTAYNPSSMQLTMPQIGQNVGYQTNPIQIDY